MGSLSAIPFHVLVELASLALAVQLRGLPRKGYAFTAPIIVPLMK
jgi:hypothetical protein